MRDIWILFKLTKVTLNINIRIPAIATFTDILKFNIGKLAGDIHQGGYYRFKYDISKLVRLKGDNL